MNVSLALTAALYGATVVNHCEVKELVKDPSTGRITAVKVKDMLPDRNADSDIIVKTKVCSDFLCSNLQVVDCFRVSSMLPVPSPTLSASLTKVSLRRRSSLPVAVCTLSSPGTSRQRGWA
jgi:hypothetical protein